MDGAQAGIAMPAAPEDGMRYRQEYYEGEAEDNGEVLSVEERAEVPYGSFDDVLLTKDTITIEPDVLEYKLYASGVGAPCSSSGCRVGKGARSSSRSSRSATRRRERRGRPLSASPVREPIRWPGGWIRRSLGCGRPFMGPRGI